MTLTQALSLNGVLFGLLIVLVSYLWKEFKRAVETRLDALTKEFHDSAPAVQDTRLTYLEQRYASLHQWKNFALPAQFEQTNKNLYGVIDNMKNDMNRRLDRIEKRILDGQRE